MLKPCASIPDAIEGMGGPRAVATRYGVAPAEVYRWAVRNFIPPGWHLRMYLDLRSRGYEPSLSGVFGLDDWPARRRKKGSVT